MAAIAKRLPDSSSRPTRETLPPGESVPCDGGKPRRPRPHVSFRQPQLFTATSCFEDRSAEGSLDPERWIRSNRRAADTTRVASVGRMSQPPCRGLSRSLPLTGSSMRSSDSNVKYNPCAHPAKTSNLFGITVSPFFRPFSSQPIYVLAFSFDSARCHRPDGRLPPVSQARARQLTRAHNQLLAHHSRPDFQRAAHQQPILDAWSAQQQTPPRPRRRPKLC